MGFYEVLDQVLELLRQRRRITYRVLKREFNLDDKALEDLKEELFFAHPVVDQDGRGLVWTGEPGQPESTSTPTQSAQLEVTQQAQAPQVERLTTDPHTPDAERRQLTVIFTDIVESTALAGQLDAEDYRDVVRAYQATCAEVIQRFDCHLAQTLGDGLLIYSGYPVAHENDAERAVRVGLCMIEDMKTLNVRLEQDKALRLAVRVGIHTGPVVVGEVGAGARQEQLALGEVPNVAARIQGLAEPDTVVISAATYRLVQGYFDCDILGEQVLRGVAEPMAVYRVLSESEAQSRLDIARARGLTPFVGREQETGLLIERWEQVKKRQGQVVLLSGEAGIGKSRLVQVLTDHVKDEAHTRFECRSSPYHQNTALYPITDLLQRLLNWKQADTPDEKLAKLEQALSLYRLPLEETVRLLAPLLSLAVPEDCYPPLGWSPQRQRQKTLETIVSILLERAERQPMLFVLEDMHWTDPTTLEFADLLINQVPTASLYVLLTCRPEFQPPWRHRSYSTEVTIHRLSPNQITQMAEQVAGGKALPDNIVQQLVDKTDGVPLYVEEMTKALLESGYLKEVGGRYALTSPVASLSIPATLQDSLMARLDRLVTAKAVAQYASVIGRQFSYDLLQTVSQLDETMLQHELRRLVEAELIYQQGIPPQATYYFKHALIQDTAYASLLRRTRQGYHRRIAEVIEERFPEIAEVQPELLVHHYTQAALNEQAVAYGRLAGEKASKRFACVEAVDYLTTALDLLALLPDTLERSQQELSMNITLGTALRMTTGGGTSEVERLYIRARELCEQVGEPTQLFSVLWGFWSVYNARGDCQAMRAVGEQLLSLAERLPDPDLLLEAHHALWTSLFGSGELTAARAHQEQGLRLYDPQRHHTYITLYSGHDPKVCSHYRAAPSLWLLGYPDQAVAKSQAALDLAQQLAHPNTLIQALYWAAVLHQLRREAPLTQVRAEAAMTIAADKGGPRDIAIPLWGWALAASGQGKEGLMQLQQGLGTYRAEGYVRDLPYHLTLLAEACAQVGQIDAGLGALAEALTTLPKSAAHWWEAELHRLQGELLLQRSVAQIAEAQACFHQALTVARHQQAKSLELRAAMSLSRLWQSQGKRQEAYDLLAPVYGWFTEGFDTADLQEAKLLLVELV